jgi:hypothetical protein
MKNKDDYAIINIDEYDEIEKENKDNHKLFLESLR